MPGLAEPHKDFRTRLRDDDYVALIDRVESFITGLAVWERLDDTDRANALRQLRARPWSQSYQVLEMGSVERCGCRADGQRSTALISMRKISRKECSVARRTITVELDDSIKPEDYAKLANVIWAVASAGDHFVQVSFDTKAKAKDLNDWPQEFTDFAAGSPGYPRGVRKAPS